MDILEAARKYERDHKSSDMSSRVQLASGLEDRYDVISPWTKAQDEIAPEEEATETPCSFTGPLYYLTKPHAEVVQEYKNMFESHVSKEWALNSNVLEILSSDKSISMFAPGEWKGISVFEPL